MTRNFWIALVFTALPFIAAPLVANALVPRNEELRELSVAVYTGIMFLGLIVLVVFTAVVRFGRRNSRLSGVWSGVLAGIALGLVSGFFTCFALMGI